MKILCTNDDGIHGEGLHLLEKVAAEFGAVTTVAPDRERSATSQAITLHSPVRMREISPDRHSVDGTPADCLWVAMNRILPEAPDVVLSGVNRGPNLALDVLYSGTVAGALEGLLRNIPSVALSFVGSPDYPFELIENALRDVLQRVFDAPLLKTATLNINIPHPLNPGIHGFRVTSLGKRYYSQEVIERQDPRGGKYLWIGGSNVTTDDIPGSDCNAVSEGYVSITPIHLNLTDHDAIEKLNEWYGQETPA
jgi:5'-nucleotidase